MSGQITIRLPLIFRSKPQVVLSRPTLPIRPHASGFDPSIDGRLVTIARRHGYDHAKLYADPEISFVYTLIVAWFFAISIVIHDQSGSGLGGKNDGKRASDRIGQSDIKGDTKGMFAASDTIRISATGIDECATQTSSSENAPGEHQDSDEARRPNALDTSASAPAEYAARAERRSVLSAPCVSITVARSSHPRSLPTECGREEDPITQSRGKDGMLVYLSTPCVLFATLFNLTIGWLVWLRWFRW